MAGKEPSIDLSPDLKLEMIEECREIFGLKAARELWEKLGLPKPPEELVEPLPEDIRH